uniref:Uncharacterized protein n=1 Tax=Anguilla anguilla TaxID=7936 RepID=A0A0E9XA40_ANGAN
MNLFGPKGTLLFKMGPTVQWAKQSFRLLQQWA